MAVAWSRRSPSCTPWRLDTIKPGQKVLLIVGREPFPLYRALELNGFSWQTERLPDGSVEVLIWNRTS